MILISSNLLKPAGQVVFSVGFLLILALPTLPALAQAGGIPAFSISEGDDGIIDGRHDLSRLHHRWAE